MRDIHEIINRVDEILKNEHNEPLAELETLRGSQYAEDVYKDVLEALNQLKRKVEAASADGAP